MCSVLSNQLTGLTFVCQKCEFWTKVSLLWGIWHLLCWIRWDEGCSRQGGRVVWASHSMLCICPVQQWCDHTHVGQLADLGENTIFILASYFSVSSVRWIMHHTVHNLRRGSLPKHVAGAGETGEQPHFPQREPTARLAAVKSRAVALTGNAAPVSNGARSHVAAFCTWSWALYPSQFPSLTLQNHHCTEIFTHLWNTFFGHWCTVGYSLCRCTYQHRWLCTGNQAASSGLVCFLPSFSLQTRYYM